MLVATWTSLNLGNKFACQPFVNKESFMNDVMDVKQYLLNCILNYYPSIDYVTKNWHAKRIEFEFNTMLNIKIYQMAFRTIAMFTTNGISDIVL